MKRYGKDVDQGFKEVDKTLRRWQREIEKAFAENPGGARR
jgi:hypothetical protein